MKTKEFIKRVEDLGFEIEECESFIRISVHEFNLAGVYRNVYMQFDNVYSGWDNLSNRDKESLFNLLVEYTSTPLDERGDEKKFYLRHRWMKPRLSNGNYLNRWIETDEYWLDCSNETEDVQTRFTLREIEEIKEELDTDLSDFEEKEVEE